MEILEKLTEKVHQASDELITLKKERRQYLSELEILRRQLSHFQSVARENERLKKDKDRLRSRFLKIQKKIDRLLLLGVTMPSQNHEEELNNEERPQ